jgi:FAD synthetase
MYAPAHLLYDIRMERAGRSCAAPRQAATMPAIALTAALIIIGDELLAGKVDDVNTPFLCRELHALGWQVAKVCHP